ncbi:MAG: hypothetical protein ACI4B5_07265, partial [Bacteroidaceae bacterium]
FQSFALPTELWHQRLNCGHKGRQKFPYLQAQSKKKVKEKEHSRFLRTFATVLGNDKAIG